MLGSVFHAVPPATKYFVDLSACNDTTTTSGEMCAESSAICTVGGYIDLSSYDATTTGNTSLAQLLAPLANIRTSQRVTE